MKDLKTLNIKLILENNNKNEININFDKFKINVNDCDENQIKLYSKDTYFYCENPLCNDDCPVSNGTAICKKNKNIDTNNKIINDKNNNICECVPGWVGDKCEKKDYADIK